MVQTGRTQRHATLASRIYPDCVTAELTSVGGRGR